MACRNGELRDGDKTNAAAASTAVMSDALLFATMFIIGLPVDVHAKDGSIYSGIFYTASVDNDYAIVLKKARMIKKGNQQANVESGSLIETLIVPAEDFVQVVAKEILLPANGITGFGDSKGIEATVGHKDHSDTVEEIKLNITGGHKKHKSRTRFSGNREVDFPYSSTGKTGNMLNSSEEHNGRLDKIYKAQIISVGGRPDEDAPQEIKNDPGDIPELKDARNTHEIQGSNPIISEKTKMQKLPEGISSSCSTAAYEDQNQKRATTNGTRCAVTSPQKISVDLVPLVDVITESRLNASSASFMPSVPPKSSNAKRTSKASTLNPGAKIFSPSTLRHRSMAPPAVPNRAGPYIADTYNMMPTATAQPEVGISSYSHASMPVKFLSYNNVAIGNEDNNVPYVQPIISQGVNRTQPVRYAGQYHDFQGGPGYVHPNPQNVMLGRVGPLVCMHPISSDGLYQTTPQSLLTPHQMHVSKHQGNVSAQALQFCTTPPIIANGPQQFVMPNSIPISQPLFPVLRPVAIPRSNGFFNTKFT